MAPAPGLATNANARADAWDRPLSRDAVALFLTEGGDERIKPDPLTGRTKYGTPTGPAPDEIWFSSSTASAVDPRSFVAAGDALDALMGRCVGGSLDPGTWFDDLRRRVVKAFGIAGTEAILSASGTEAELIALTLTHATADRPLTSIVIAPRETGNGVMEAAAGRHFLASASLGGTVAAGHALPGFESADIEVQGVAIRDAFGQPLNSGTIDDEAATLVAQALSRGRDVLLHVLDTSKSGLAGVTRQTALDLAVKSEGRVRVVVDACQLRCSPDRIRADLAAGFMVMVTGSKFAGGPPFVGALLLPRGFAERLCAQGVMLAGLDAYSASLDWPSILRRKLVANLDVPFNLGLGLRWEAALALIESYYALSATRRATILARFAAAIEHRVAARAHLRLAANDASDQTTIFPIITHGASASPAGAAALYVALAAPRKAGAPEMEQRCHVGQPVPIADEAALRVCSSMPLVLDVAARMAKGNTLEDAFAPVGTKLDILFRKWDQLVGC